jgi:hypothetical protein
VPVLSLSSPYFPFPLPFQTPLPADSDLSGASRALASLCSTPTLLLHTERPGRPKRPSPPALPNPDSGPDVFWGPFLGKGGLLGYAWTTREKNPVNPGPEVKKAAEATVNPKTTLILPKVIHDTGPLTIDLSSSESLVGLFPRSPRVPVPKTTLDPKTTLIQPKVIHDTGPLTIDLSSSGSPVGLFPRSPRVPVPSSGDEVEDEDEEPESNSVVIQKVIPRCIGKSSKKLAKRSLFTFYQE